LCRDGNQLLILASFSQHKSLDVIQLFHKAGNPASVRVANLLKQISAAASEAATQDQAQSNRDVFELNITEEAPTAEQLGTILDYVGKPGLSSVVKGANTPTEALNLFKKNPDNLQRPLVRLRPFSPPGNRGDDFLHKKTAG